MVGSAGTLSDHPGPERFGCVYIAISEMQRDMGGLSRAKVPVKISQHSPFSDIMSMLELVIKLKLPLLLLGGLSH